MSVSSAGPPDDRESASASGPEETRIGQSRPKGTRTARATTLQFFSSLLSLRLTVVLLLLLVAATAAGALIPQHGGQIEGGAPGGVLQAVGLDSVFESWWYAGLLVALAGQTALCTVSRSRTAWVQLARPGDYRPEGSPAIRVPGTLAEGVERASDLGYRLVAGASGEGCAVLVRGRPQPLGFLVLHVGLVVLIGGSIWNLQGTSTTTLLLPPGERVLLAETDQQLELRDLRAVFDVTDPAGGGWELVSLEADVQVYRGADLLREDTVALGAPFEFGGGELVLVPVLDRYQVTLRGEGPSGRQVTGRLRSDAPQLDLLGGAGGLIAVVADFEPDGLLRDDAERDDGGDAQLGRAGPLSRPLATVQLVGRDDGLVKATSALELGETVAYGGYAVTFVEAGYVPVAVMSSTAGRPLLVFGSVAILVGMLLALVFSFRLVWLRIDEDGLVVQGFARRHHQPLGDELALLASPPGYERLLATPPATPPAGKGTPAVSEDRVSAGNGTDGRVSGSEGDLPAAGEEEL